MTIESVPAHVAVIMDGNGRWAQMRNLPRTFGHKKGFEGVKIIEFCLKKKIKVLTLFAFGKENWKRPPEEVNYLFDLFKLGLKRDIKKLDEHQVRLRIIGDRTDLAPSLVESIEQAEKLTESHSRLILNVAINYSGRWDIKQAVQKMQSVGATDFEPFLSLAGLPDPDLLIRTGSAYRLSNFLLWNLAYTELYFTSTFYPDFTEAEFDKALQFFAAQERRFGHTSDQLKSQLKS